jgi:hypothetical protein
LALDEQKASILRSRTSFLVILGLAFLIATFCVLKALETSLTKRATIRVSERVTALEKSTGVKIKSDNLKVGFGKLRLSFVEVLIPASSGVPAKRKESGSTAADAMETVDIFRKIEPALKNLIREFNDETTPLERSMLRRMILWFLPKRVAFDIEQLKIATTRSGAGESDSEPILRASGFHVRFDRRKPRIHYHAEEIQIARLVPEHGISGHLRIWRQPGLLELTVIKGPHQESGTEKGGWHIRTLTNLDGRNLTAEIEGNHMPRLLASFSDGFLVPSSDTTFRARFHMKRLGTKMLSFSSAAKISDIFLRSKLIASGTTGPLRLSSEINGTYEPGRNELIIDHGRFEIPTPVDFEPLASGMAQRSHHDFAVDAGSEPAIIVNFQVKGEWKPPAAVQRILTSHFPGPGQPSSGKREIKLFIARTPCQALIDVLPESLAPAIRKFELGGDFMGMLTASWPAGRPELFQSKITHPEFTCEVTREPIEFAASNYIGPIKMRRGSRGMPEREILLATENQSYRQLKAISPVFLKTLVAAEDSGFWVHGGVEPGGFLDALRDNLTEGRIARGGSTITMQLVKNLMLNRERTASRKVQELFLAWYLGKALPRERILELYANAIELGPNIFGVTEAADLFFGMSPAELGLAESLFLVNLLPAPISRVESFCRKQKPTENFTILMKNLLARMEHLKMISSTQARQVQATGLRFRSDELSFEKLCNPEKEAS